MKAILVIDMPKDCEHCDLMASFVEDCARCSVTYTPIRNGKAKKECPLRPMPEKKEPFYDINIQEYDKRVDGWNDCIEEIEK